MVDFCQLRAQQLLATFASYTLVHVPRAENSQADRLANHAMDTQQNGTSDLAAVAAVKLEPSAADRFSPNSNPGAHNIIIIAMQILEF